MTRLELLQLVVGRARSNGFELRRWYTTRLGLPWISADAALVLLDSQRRYYALIFSHEFAHAFWKPGSEITFEIPHQSFQRSMPDGSTRTIHRKAFMRRSVRPNAWKYHLRQMALAEEPLRYLRKYLHIEEDLVAEPDGLKDALPEFSGKRTSLRRQEAARALPLEPPAFLQRPYRPTAAPTPPPRRTLLP